MRKSLFSLLTSFFVFPIFLCLRCRLSHEPCFVISDLIFGELFLIYRYNAVVQEHGDTFRDTVALTVRGDGVDIPPFIIVHTYRNASYRSGRRCAPGDDPVKGMNIVRMKLYLQHISQYVEKTSLLCMDRLSSHTSKKIREYVESFKLADGQRMFIPIYLAPKTAFLISPLDMGANAAFKAYYHRLDRSTIDLKIRAVHQAWDQVSNESLLNICSNCGVIGEDSLPTIRQRFMKEVVNTVPSEIAGLADYYESWTAGQIEVEGCTRARGISIETPSQLSEGFMDGVYWNNFGNGTPRKKKSRGKK